MSPTVSKESTRGDRGVARIVRDFDFPRKTVFRMFTDPKRAAKWFGTPDGMDPVFFELDPRPGGAIQIHDREGNGPIHRTSGTVLEVVEPERFAFKSVTTLQDGAAPFEAMQTVTLEDLSPGRTRMVVVVKVLSAGSFPGGVEALVEGYAGGWGGSLDKLQRQLG